ncbi:transcriptional regulator, AraC family [Priestia aryabhattai B8W22]|uniref:helix-turn-helix transcriptional regulator n=1 Tax=Priestia aryabhattai TaxID=412384 RepID=UPI000884143F|nr:transcriptional regulator, AraC family [Priestia aryabhattai B8W22]
MDTLREIICEKRAYSYSPHTHDHNYSQLLFPLAGALNIQASEQHLTLQEGCFYIPPRQLHTYQAKNTNECLVVDIPLKFTESAHLSQQAAFIQWDSTWKAIRYLLLDGLQKSTDRGALEDLVRYVQHYLPKKQTFKSIDYLHANFNQELNIESLAKLENYHPAYFSAWFKQKTGYSPQSYVARIRLNKAKELLKESSYSITYIAHEVGYQSLSSFTKWFAKQEGVSPTQYRRILKTDK